MSAATSEGLARDATAADLFADPGHEGSYRRGVHQALAFAVDLLDRARTKDEARRLLASAEEYAGRLRFREKDRGNGMLLDEINGRLRRKRGG
jgi:hypothetical protein